MTHFVGDPRSSTSTSNTVVPSAPSSYAIIGGCGVIAVSPPTGATSRVTPFPYTCSDSALCVSVCGAVSVTDVVVVCATVRQELSARRQTGTFDLRLGGAASCG